MAKQNILTLMEKKLSPLNINILEDLSFGSLDGERDTNLKDSFVLTKAIQELLRHNYNYVLSPKGAGKSAVFKALMDKYKIPKKIFDFNKYHFIAINKAFDTTDDIYLDKIKFKSDLGYKKYTVSWSFYIAIKLIEDILKNHTDKFNFNEFQNKLRKFDNFKDKYELYNILDYVENFNVALKYSAGGVEYTIRPSFANKKNTKPLKINEVFGLINEFYKKNNLTARVLIDRIDNFVEKEEYEIQKNYLQGLIYAIEEISLLSHIQPLLFLRTDLFYSHSINIEYDKIRDRMIELKWTKGEILMFIVYRFLSNEQIIKNHSEFFDLCIKQNISKLSGFQKHTSKINIVFRKIFPRKHSYDLAKNIDYDISYQFLKLYFPNKTIHKTENNKEESVEFSDWIFTHFVDGNNFVNPRTLLRFLNLLTKRQLNVYEEHNLVPNQIIEVQIIDDTLSYILFRDFVIQDVYEHLQNEELRNIYKLLYSKESQNIFLRLNQLSITHPRISYGDINLKSFNCEKDEYDRILKYLCLLGYLTIVDARTFKVTPIYKRSIELT